MTGTKPIHQAGDTIAIVTMQRQQQLLETKAGEYEDAPRIRWTCPLYIWAVVPTDESEESGYNMHEQVTLTEEQHAEFYIVIHST